MARNGDVERTPRRGAGYVRERLIRLSGAVEGTATVGKPGSGIGNRTYPPCVTGVPSISRPIIPAHDARSWYTPKVEKED
jgi:hypothetical protein